jgi:hypothetical protein
MPTPKQQLSELVFRQATGLDLPTWIAGRRPGQSWRELSQELYRLTDGEVSVTHTSLVTWYGDRSEAGVA